MNQFLSVGNLKRFVPIVVLLFLSVLTEVSCRNDASATRPERIILNVTSRPATSQAVTWRTHVAANSPQAQITPAKATFDLENSAMRIVATVEPLIIAGKTYYYYAAIFDSLLPNTLYAYRVGDGVVWSEWNQFRTAEAVDAPFQFIYLGDPQNDIESLCSRVFRLAYQKAPDVRFWLIAGDNVNIGDSDGEWGELFEAFGWIARTTPFMMLPGNHEYIKIQTTGKTARQLTPLWRPQFFLPENGPQGLEETVYYVDYQNTRFVMLNGNEQLEKQADWLAQLLADNPNRWTIVSIHQPIYASGKDRDHVHLQKLFLPIFDKFYVDLVLQGHDHCYSRTYKLHSDKAVSDDDQGTVYVVSVTGTKIYELNPLYLPLMVKMETGKQLFQIISISNERLLFEAWTANGELFDSFELRK